VLRSAEFLEARNRDGHAWRMVLQGALLLLLLLPLLLLL
jgi:hypothetical protein